MHWWQGAFTSTAAKSQSEEESVVIGDGAAGASRDAAKTGFFSSRRNRLITRARKPRQVAENEAENWRSPSHLQNSPARAGLPSSSPASPQPLPLPELRVLLQRDSKFASSSSCSVPLPSPDDIPITRGCDDKERERDRERETAEAMNGEAIDGTNGLRRLVGQDSKANSEHSEMQPSRKSLHMQYTNDKSSDSYDISNSAPATPYSSLELSPRKSDTPVTQYRTHSGFFQVWSAPDTMPHSDGNLNQGFSYHIPPEKSASTVDNSTSFPSPSNSQATVHPLPLPPGAASMASQPISISSPGPSTPSQSTPISSHTPKPEFPGASMADQLSPFSPAGSIPELVPIKSQWQKGKLIGRGTFGSVYVASNRETGALCAMKEVDILPDDSKSAECMRQLEQEIKVLSHLKHPNIVQYYGSEIVGDKFYIYLEYVHPGSINRFIQDHCGAITESVVRNFTRHILCGLAYLHSTKTIHRDIKGANLLVDAYGVVKLADFGMAKHLNGQTANLSLKGSPYWMAPELMQSAKQADASSNIALAVDIWSLGCTIVEMMNGKPPFSEYEGAAALFKVLKETPPIPETLSADGKDFLQCCFRRNPADRPTASKLLDHPFVNHSHQPEACTQSLTKTKCMDNTPLLRERPRHKLELPQPLGTQIKKGRLTNNDNTQRSPLQAAHLAVVTLPSPCSILEALPTLPLPSPERCLERNINSSNLVLSSLKHAANI